MKIVKFFFSIIIFTYNLKIINSLDFKIFYDAEIDHFVRSNIVKLMNSVKINVEHSDINIIYFNNKNINASIANPKLMTINSGIFSKLDSPYELIAILSHEVGHVKNNHITRKFSSLEYSKKDNKLLYSLMLGSAIVNPIIPITAIMVKAQGERNMDLKYSREYETEADLEGIEILKKNGYDPLNLYETMSKMDKESKKIYDEEFQNNIKYLVSHPITSERLKYLAIKTKKNTNEEYRTSSKTFDQFYRIKAKIMGYIDNEKVFLKKSEIDEKVRKNYDFYKDYFLIHKSLANEKATKTDFEKLLIKVEKILSKNPEDIYLIEIKFTILEKINRNIAIEYMIKNINIFKEESRLIIMHSLLNAIDKEILSGEKRHKDYAERISLDFCKNSKMFGKNNFCYLFFKHCEDNLYSKYYEGMSFLENENFEKSKQAFESLIKMYDKNFNQFEKKNIFFTEKDLKYLVEKIVNMNKSLIWINF